jgi:hypothetical protein
MTEEDKRTIAEKRAEYVARGTTKPAEGIQGAREKVVADHRPQGILDRYLPGRKK